MKEPWNMIDGLRKLLLDVSNICCILYIFVILTTHFIYFNTCFMQFQDKNFRSESYSARMGQKWNDGGLQIKVRKVWDIG